MVIPDARMTVIRNASVWQQRGPNVAYPTPFSDFAVLAYA
jgi:hypothetical protein